MNAHSSYAKARATDRNTKRGGRKRVFISVLAIAVVMSACSSGSSTSTAQGSSAPVSGGTANVAIVSDPPTLDWTYSTSTITHEVSWNIFEQLFTLDKQYTLRPMLAEGFTMSPDGLVYTLPLRKDVHFQNGQPMTADDVIASLKRWGSISSPGKQVSARIADTTAPDSHTVVITLKQPYSPLIPDLASPDQAAIVLPASIARAAGEKPLSDEQVVGTGPYKLKQWKRGQVVQLAKWNDYVPLPASDDWGGLAGHKTAYIDQINFRVTPDPSVRLSGLQTGEFTVSTELSSDSYDQLKQSSSAQPVLIDPAAAMYIVFNKRKPPFTDVTMREAINLVSNKKEIAASAFGDPKFWSLDSSMFFPQQATLHTDAGDSAYKAYDPTKAADLMKRAGYDSNRPIRILTTKTYPYMYNAGVALAQELDSIGIKTDVQVYDWPTDLARRMDDSSWDVFITTFAVEFDPTQFLWISPSYNGWYNSPKMQSALAGWAKANTMPEKQAALQLIQTIEWQELPAVKVANRIILEGASTKLQNFKPYLDVVLWNTWLSQ